MACSTLIQPDHVSGALHLQPRESLVALLLARLRASDLHPAQLQPCELLLKLPRYAVRHGRTTHVVARSVRLAVIEGDGDTGVKGVCQGSTVVEGVSLVEGIYVDAAAGGAREGVVAGVAADVHGLLHGRLRVCAREGGSQC